MKTTTILNIFLRIVFIIYILLQNMQPVLNSPAYGKLVGKKIKVLNKYVYAYLGIPYAAPPVGNLRFQEPHPAKYKDTIYNATRKSSSCMQNPPYPILEWIDRNPKEVSEDCLHLNVWVPTTNDDGKRFATMVWIYGGAFVMGSSNQNVYDGAVLASMGNVIVVSFNYRQSALGYSNFGKYEAQGNMGMLDQVMALKWIHRNINSFGGDKDLITLFGQSAGAISIAHHLISPLTKGLFRRAILQSGSNYLENYAIDQNFNIKTTIMLSQEVGCNGSDILNCMKEKDAYEIVSTEKRLIKHKKRFFLLSPQVGPPFLPKDPFYHIDTGKFHNVDILMGDVKEEGSVFALALNPERLIENNPVFLKDSAKDMFNNFLNMSEERLKSVMDEYLENVAEEDYSKILKQTIKAIGDAAFTCPIFHLAERLSEYHRKIYHYRFNHTRIKSLFPKWMGVPHFEDIHFVFGRPLLKKKAFTSEEVEFSKNIIQLWTSFAKTGKPTYDGFKKEWKPFDKRNRNSLSITLDNIHPVKAEINENCEFWKDFFRDYTNKMYMY